MARYVRVCSISFGGSGGAPTPQEHAQRNRAVAISQFQRAMLEQPDIVCMPEALPALGLTIEHWRDIAEPVPGPTTEAFGRLARQHNCWVICPVIERYRGRMYNTAVIINRRGEVAGRYRKMHPTIGEIEGGVTPGNRPVVIETDFGRIGCAICFDLNFRDVIEGLSRAGAELVFFPSMYRGGLQMQIWAHDFSVYMVSACTSPGSAIVNPLGRILTESQPHQLIISRTINLDMCVLHLDYNYDKFDAIKQRYRSGVELEVATPEAKFMLISHMPEVTADDIVREFELEPLRDYFIRANRVRQRALRAKTSIRKSG